jgi:hypothetical protein
MATGPDAVSDGATFFGITSPDGTGADGSEPAEHTSAPADSATRPFVVDPFNSTYAGMAVDNVPDTDKSTFAQYAGSYGFGSSEGFADTGAGQGDPYATEGSHVNA